MKQLFGLVAAATLSTGAFAHSNVETTTPANGSVMSALPNELSFSFSDDIRLTRVMLLFEDQPPVHLDLGDQKSFDRNFTLPLTAKGAGAYHIEWRGLGIDGHAMQGTVSFTVE